MMALMQILSRRGPHEWRRAGCRLLHEGPDTVEELLERHLEKPKTKKKSSIMADEDVEMEARRRLTSTKREALALYRDIIRATRFFLWTNNKGILWRDILRANARQEFEEARFESDPEIIAKLLVGGHDAVQKAIDMAIEKQRKIIEENNNKQNRNN